MSKKVSFCVVSFLILILLSGCPDKDKNKSEEPEQIPNTMEKAASELEQIITLLGGPMFDSRDRIEQLKKEQMQALLMKAEENAQLSTTGSEKTMQDQKKEGSDSGEAQQGGQNNKPESEQQKNTDGQEQKEPGGEGEQEKGKGSEPKKEAGSEQQNEPGSSQDTSKQNQKPGSEEDKGTQPSPEKKEEKPFQFDDSLFGMPQWNDENWKMIKVLTDGMYFTWNNLQPELLEKGVTEVQGESFGASLENLSKAIQSKNIGDAQTSAFELYDKLSEFFSYYKTDKPPELKRVSSMVTGIHFSVRQNDWNKAQELSNQLQKEFTKVKINVQDNASDAIKMLELSLDDLRSAVQKQDAILVLIRTNLVTANIEDLDTRLSQAQKG